MSILIPLHTKREPSYPSEKVSLVTLVSISLSFLAAFKGCCSKELRKFKIQDLLKKPSKEISRPIIGIPYRFQGF